MLSIYKDKRRIQPPVKVYRDGREVCVGRTEYKRRREEMEIRQNFKCAICQRLHLVMEFDHESGRGHRGARRDDRISDENGEWMNAALCDLCNRLKGSRRYKWIGGEYLPVTKFQEVA